MPNEKEPKEQPVIVNGRVFWRIGDRLLPGVGGGAGEPPAPDKSDPPPAQDPPEKKFMTAEDFNGAMTARERRFEDRLAKQVAAQLEKFWAAKNQPADPADPAAGGEGTETEAQPPDTAESPRLKRISAAELAVKKATAKVDQLTKQMAAKEEAAAKEKAELLDRQEKADMIAALASAGVTTAKGAYAALKMDGRIRRNADGELVMVVVKDYAGTRAEEEVPIAQGIKEWLATDDGKHFLPPRGGGDGSGTVVRSGTSRGGGQLSKEEKRQEAHQALRNFIFGQR